MLQNMQATIVGKSYLWHLPFLCYYYFFYYFFVCFLEGEIERGGKAKNCLIDYHKITATIFLHTKKKKKEKRKSEELNSHEMHAVHIENTGIKVGKVNLNIVGHL